MIGSRCKRLRSRDTATTKTRHIRCLPNAGHGSGHARTLCVAPVWWLERCAQNPIPSRTRPLNAPAPMVLCLKARESRSPPDPHNAKPTHSPTRSDHPGAGWSSPVARQAHNLKVTGSNPVPATKTQPQHQHTSRFAQRGPASSCRTPGRIPRGAGAHSNITTPHPDQRQKPRRWARRTRPDGGTSPSDSGALLGLRRCADACGVRVHTLDCRLPAGAGRGRDRRRRGGVGAQPRREGERAVLGDP